MATIKVTDADGNEYDMEPPAEDGERTNNEWARLRKETTARTTAEKAAAEKDKQIAFLRAGIDPDDARMKYFAKGYEGAATPEAVKAAAIEAGFLPAEGAPAAGAAADQGSQPGDPTKPPTQQQMDTAALAAAQRIASASIGANPDQADGIAALDQAFIANGQQGVMDALRAAGVVVKQDNQD